RIFFQVVRSVRKVIFQINILIFFFEKSVKIAECNGESSRFYSFKTNSNMVINVKRSWKTLDDKSLFRIFDNAVYSISFIAEHYSVNLIIYTISRSFHISDKDLVKSCFFDR